MSFVLCWLLQGLTRRQVEALSGVAALIAFIVVVCLIARGVPLWH